MKKSVSRNKAQSSLKKKGFVEITKAKGRKGGGKAHLYYYHEYNGKRTGAYTYISHGPKHDLEGDLLKSMKMQLQLDSQSEVVELLKCPMSKKSYNAILISKGVFPG